jgi:choline kinase
MRAILLAAGRGRRLGSDTPKCLLSIEGKTLLERHCVNLLESAITDLTIVVGFQKEAVASILPELPAGLRVELIENRDFLRGSILSLHVAVDAGRLDQGGLWMDADVLYPSALLRRLVGSRHENCLLLDGSSKETGEEMMLGTRGGRVLTIARRVGASYELAGESVGFAKVGPSGARIMKRILAEEVSGGRIDQEYEAAMDRAFRETSFGFERVDDVPWTEIDFEEDVERARRIARALETPSRFEPATSSPDI